MLLVPESTVTFFFCNVHDQQTYKQTKLSVSALIEFVRFDPSSRYLTVGVKVVKFDLTNKLYRIAAAVYVNDSFPALA